MSLVATEPRWDAWDVTDARSVLESLRDLAVGPNVTKADWESACFDILAGFAAIAEPLKSVPVDLLEMTRELVLSGLLEEAAGSGAEPAFSGASGWPLPSGSWSNTRGEARRRLRLVKAWGAAMLKGLAARPAATSGSGAPGPAGGSGAAGATPPGLIPGSIVLTPDQLTKLVQDAVAAATATAPSAHAGGSAASGVAGRYQRALTMSQGHREGWTVERSAEVRARVLQEGAKLRGVLLRFASEHAWKRPGRALEASSFPEMVWARPLLEDEDCDVDELPAGEEASQEDWCVLVHLLRERVAEMQGFARGKDPGAVFEEVVDDSFARKRARSPSPPSPAKRAHVDPAALTGVSGAAVALTPGRRGDLAAAATSAGLRTVTDEQLQRALNGTLVPESIPQPPGAGSLRPVVPRHAGGVLAGLDLRVYPGVSLDAPDRRLVLSDDGRSIAMESGNRRSRCTTLPEWERGFLTVMRKVASEREYRLMMYFKEWFASKAAEYGTAPLLKFYDFMILQMEEDPSYTFERRSYSECFEDYSREQQLRPSRTPRPWQDHQGGRGGKGKGGKGGAPLQPALPADRGGKGGKGKGGRGRGRAGLPRVARACALHQTGTCTFDPCRFDHVCGDCGAADHVAGAAGCPGH